MARWLTSVTVAMFAMGGGLPAGAQNIVLDAKASLADLPTWKIPEICVKDSAQAHCLVLESRAWRTVSGSWISLPDTVKKTCLGGVKSAGDQSWRALSECVDEESEKQGDKHAVATARTPAEPVPPPKPVAVPISGAAGIPAPVLGLTVAPPPFATDAEAAAKKASDGTTAPVAKP